MIRRAYYVAAYYASWAVFGAVGVLLNVASLPLLLLPRTPTGGASMRRVIRALFDFWLRWMHATGVVRVTWRGFERPLAPGAVFIANHPTLVDATFLLARLPDAICIFKPALMRNPAIGPAAVLAGYASGVPGVDLVREVAAKIAAGQSLLVFPEGTRTDPGRSLNPLRPGFALIAARAAAPVQLFTIRASEGLVPRGRAWWKPPIELPGWVEISLDRCWDHDANRSPADLTEEVQRHLSTQLANAAEIAR
ncbi:MAG TPA: lysophospholipid acyltransferase family protein [Opitutaceae bacterium]|nr:lysophospholipid acyltransferase family protein [Opitutaceae bacterium]